MSGDYCDSDGFQLVSRRKGVRRKGVLPQPGRRREEYCGPSCEELCRRLESSRAEIEKSQFYREFLSLAQRCVGTHPAFSELVCYGIGCFGESLAARHQLAFLMALQHHWKPDCVWVFDPMLSAEECSAIRQLGYQLIPQNELCRRATVAPTLFYMPHCGRAMYNNLLWANWSRERLAHTTIIGNSFSSYSERLPSKQLKEEAPFIYHISPHASEHRLPWQKFTHPHSFTDTSLHTFTPHTLPPSLWDLVAEEPSVDPTDPEIVTT